MARINIAKPGKSLGWWEGFAGLRPADVAYRVRRAALTGAAVTALITGFAASLAAVQGDAQPGVEGNRNRLEWVSPTGYAWEDGLRPGQTIVAIGEDDSPDGWFMETTDGTRTYRTAQRDPDRTLASSLPVGALALVLGAIASLFLRTRRRWVVPTASVAVLAASIPLQYEGEPIASTLAMGAAVFVPGSAFAVRVPSWLRPLAFAGLATLVASWAWMRITGAGPNGVDLDDVWNLVGLWVTVALVLERSVVSAVTSQSIGVLRPRLFDIGALVGLVLLAVVAALLLGLPPIAVLVIVALMLAAVPALRHRMGRPVEDVLFADVREQAAAEATELERARLARELHDVPLQELAAVIRRLEILPGAEAESEDLRALAGHLRNVATELRPPVLDDLGLPAALDFLAEETSTPTLPVTAKVQDDTGFGEDRRPPTDVELAMYRIAAEAVGNAIRHSGGTMIGIDAAVAPGKVELTIRDDGSGLGSGKAREAARQKRLGLASMRRRAEAIDAELSIDGSSNGTQVRVVWQA